MDKLSTKNEKKFNMVKDNTLLFELVPTPWSLGQSPKLRKPHTAPRFWFAQGIEAVSFFAAGEKDTSG
jgi:hypothetical protein